jgi:hypothetical protein
MSECECPMRNGMHDKDCQAHPLPADTPSPRMSEIQKLVDRYGEAVVLGDSKLQGDSYTALLTAIRAMEKRIDELEGRR